MHGKTGESPFIAEVDMAGSRGRVAVIQGSLHFCVPGKEKGPEALYRHGKEISLFECLVTNTGKLYVVLADEEGQITGLTLGKFSWVRLFETYQAPGILQSLCLACGLNSQLHVFYSSKLHNGGRLHHSRVDRGTLKQVEVLEEGGREDFGNLKSFSDLWGSFNLFYLAMEKGVFVLRHKYFIPISKHWNPSVTLQGPKQGDAVDYTALVDRDNTIYLALLLGGARKNQLIFLKREMGGWPRGGWNRPVLISLEDGKGIPLIDLYQKGYIQILFQSREKGKLFVWRDGEAKTLQKKELDLKGKAMVPFRSSSAGRPEYMLLDRDLTIPPSPEPPGETGKVEGGEEKDERRLEKERSPNCQGIEVPAGPDPQDTQTDDFIRQAERIMKARSELEANLRKKENELAREKKNYENQLRLVKDQLASRTEALKNLEARISHQEAASLGLQTEQQSLERENKKLKKENRELREEKEREKIECRGQVEALKRELNEVKYQLEASRGFMGKLGRIFKGD